MKIAIPASVDVNKLIEGLNLSRTKTKTLINKTNYFLSLITPNNLNYEKFEKNNGYRNISSISIKKILGKDYYPILDILKNDSNPIIDCNETYYNSKSAGFCKGYRLNKLYCTGKVHYITLDPKLENKIKREFKESIKNDNMNIRYDFLLNQFKIHDLSFDERIYEYIKNLGNELLGLVENNNSFQTQLIYNKVGQWLYYIECINNKDIWYNVSQTNYRLSSSITSLPKLLRPFLLCEGKPLTMVDIKSSQPYLLGSIMNNKYFTEITTGFNLKTIYSDMYDELMNNDIIINHNGLNGIEYESNYSGSTVYNYSGSCSFTETTSPIMWCTFLKTLDKNGIRNYIQSPFNDDFYLHTIKIKYPELTIEELTTKRDEMKKNMMYFMFEGKKHHRRNNETIKLLSSVYPSINEWINNVHATIGNKKFSYILQRTESYLILDKICREFNVQHPTIPIFTIHDAILIDEEYIPDLTSLILRRCKEITGIDVGFKVSILKIDCKPSSNDIERIWEKIKKIKTEEKYNELQGVFVSNITKGQDYLQRI